MGADSKVFAGKDVPKGVRSWSLFTADGKRCMAPGGEGVEIGEFPIEQLDVETIRSVWGEGTYRLQYIGERGGKRKPLGSRIINVSQTVSAKAPPPPLEPARDDVGMGDSMRGVFAIVDAIERRADVQAQRDREFLRAVLDARGGREDASTLGVVRELAAVVQGLQAQVAALTTAPDDDDDDDDDDEDDDDSRLFRPGESIKDTAVAEGLNGLVSVVKDLAPALQGLAAAKMQELAEDIRRKQAAAATPALNGASETHAEAVASTAAG